VIQLGAILVFGALASKLMNGTTTTTTTTTPTAPPRPACGIGEKAVYSSSENKWFCVPKAFG